MAFYKPDGELLTPGEFVDYYEPCYFRCRTPKHVKNVKTSSCISETKIERILEDGIKSENDVKIILAWKTGKINHTKTIESNKIQFADNWKTDKIKILYKYISNDAPLEKDPDTVRSELMKITDGIGPVIAQTFLYFISKGKYPIYDKYAYLALKAWADDTRPGIEIKYPEPTEENFSKRIIEYTDDIVSVFSLESKDLSKTQYKYRRIDRALWVYGHCFTDAQRSCGCC